MEHEELMSCYFLEFPGWNDNDVRTAYDQWCGMRIKTIKRSRPGSNSRASCQWHSCCRKWWHSSRFDV